MRPGDEAESYSGWIFYDDIMCVLCVVCVKCARNFRIERRATYSERGKLRVALQAY